MSDATHMYVGINAAGEPRAWAYDDPGYERDTMQIVLDWFRMGRDVKRVTVADGWALLSASKPPSPQAHTASP